MPDPVTTNINAKLIDAKEFEALGVAGHAGQTLQYQAGLADGTRAKVLIPDGPHKMKLVPLWTEKNEARPRRVRAVAVFFDLKSLIEYVNQFKLANTIALYRIDTTTGCIAVGFDYHHRPGTASDGGEPEWLTHRAEFPFPKSPQWDAWSRKEGSKMSQGEFVEFFEENADDIMDPAPARLLEALRAFEVTRTAQFRSVANNRTGAIQFRYEETDAAAGGEGRPTGQMGEALLPAEFKLRLPLFQGGDVYEIPCRLRWRLERGKLDLLFAIPRKWVYVRDALNGAVEQFRTGTGLTPLHGLIASLNKGNSLNAKPSEAADEAADEVDGTESDDDEDGEG